MGLAQKLVSMEGSAKPIELCGDIFTISFDGPSAISIRLGLIMRGIFGTGAGISSTSSTGGASSTGGSCGANSMFMTSSFGAGSSMAAVTIVSSSSVFGFFWGASRFQMESKWVPSSSMGAGAISVCSPGVFFLRFFSLFVRPCIKASLDIVE